MSNYRRYFLNNNFPVFITFVTYNRNNILIPNIDILKNSFKYAKEKYVFEIIAICVMKNHCHLIIDSVNNEIPSIIRTIKYNFSINIPIEYVDGNLSLSAIKRGEKGVWQRRYYDHILKNENDLSKHIDYIHYNSMKHYNIAPKDWEFSSFHKFVKNNYYEQNWCNSEDKNDILKLDLE